MANGLENDDPMSYEISVEDPRQGKSVSNVYVSGVDELKRKLKEMVVSSVTLKDEVLGYESTYKVCNVDELSDEDLQWLIKEGTSRFIKLR